MQMKFELFYLWFSYLSFAFLIRIHVDWCSVLRNKHDNLFKVKLRKLFFFLITMLCKGLYQSLSSCKLVHLKPPIPEKWKRKRIPFPALTLQLKIYFYWWEDSVLFTSCTFSSSKLLSAWLFPLKICRFPDLAPPDLAIELSVHFFMYPSSLSYIRQGTRWKMQISKFTW